MNPFAEQRPTEPGPRSCVKCRDMGFTLPPPFDPNLESPNIPPGVLYNYGKPCTCRAGQEFAHDQTLWNAPDPIRAGPEPQPISERFQNSANWEPPAWSDPPPKRQRLAINDGFRITQADVDVAVEAHRTRKPPQREVNNADGK